MGTRAIALGAPRQRAVLAILAIRAGQTVSRTELIDGVWGTTAPPSVDGSVHTYIYGLRRALSVAGEDVLVRAGSGYRLVLDPDDVDLAVAEAGFRRARELATAGGRSAAADVIAESLSLWRGTPLFGIPGPFAEAERVRLTKLRYQLIEERAELMLATGRHQELITELGEAVEAEPFRERLRAQHMLALYRSGRRADALAEFDMVRRLFVAELGLDPGTELRDLHLRMLRSDPSLEPAGTSIRTRSPIPAQLPHEVADFVGRAGEIEQLAKWRIGTASTGQALVISAIDGAGGIGKTSLAVRFARQVAPNYPDGQLYLDLRGFDPNRPPLSPSEALGHLLWALGSSSRRQEPEAQASLYRSLLSGKRVLILLDNAVSTEQVRGLLPGVSSSLVLVTSRNRLSGLVARDGARRLTLGLLTEAEALELLRNAIGAERVDAEPAEAARLAQLCGYLPLALRVAAEKISSRSDRSLHELVENLIDEQLDALELDDDEMSSVRGIFSWSYDSLDPALARAFRYLGLLPGPDVGIAAAAALVGATGTETENLLRSLSDQHLLDDSGDRFHFHDLIRTYAGELVKAQETEEERAAAMHSLLAWYLFSARSAIQRILPDYHLFPANLPSTPYDLPDLDSPEAARAWCALEALNVLALTERATELGEYGIAWQLAWCMYEHYYSTGQLTEWRKLLTVALVSAEQLEDPEPQMRILIQFGIASSRLGRNDEAVRHLERGVALARPAGNEDLLLRLLVNLASTLREMKQYDQGIQYAQEAFQLTKKFGGDYRTAGCLDSLCELYAESNQPEKALEYGAIGLEAARAAGASLLEANMLVNTAHAHRDLGDPAMALRQYEAALRLCRKLGDRYHEALALLGIATLQKQASRLAQARELAHRALDIFVRLDGEEADVARAFLAGLDDESS
ncbi:AfsR/SARP family transcriptional regulator [Amycolatopsis oliviviridis]|uniref:AfsR/SARP family transcriptional regulator n=1 Tax=Amycolatopsis oliviviridis TaxID=1471590 RepID=UPI001E5A2A68|nr:AfsR/SARP family transcriptional regulator [Amycolatopsis oliviviridis]